MARNAQSKDIIYCLVNSKEHYVISSGIGFSDFVESLEKPLSNLLLLKHQYENAEFHYHTQFDYVSIEDLDDLVKTDISRFNHFSWVDFEDIFGLDHLEGQALAELLYLAHVKKHLAPPFYQELNNRFAYISSYDGWLNRVYYRNWVDFYNVLGGNIAKKLSEMKLERSLFSFNKRRNYPKVPVSTIYQLSTFLTEGVVFSIQDAKSEKSSIEIPFWVVGDYYNMDEMMERFQEKKEGTPQGKLIIDKKQKEWSVQL